MTDNFIVKVVLPGSEAEKEIERQLEEQKQAEIAQRLRRAAELEKQYKAERALQEANQKRIEAGELKPLTENGIPVHRVDFFETADGVKVKKIHRSDTTKTDHVVSTEVKPVDLEASRRWLVANGYIVRQWPGGMRAWFGRLWPIRNRSEIMAMRSRLGEQRARETNTVDTSTIDCAYDM